MPAKFDVWMDRRPDGADVRLVGELGLAVLVAAHERFHARGVETWFIRPDVSVMRVFEFAGLDAALEFRNP